MIHLLDPSITREQAYHLRKARTNHRIGVTLKTITAIIISAVALAVIL